MSWLTLTTDDVLEEFTPAEKAALDAVKGGDTLAAIVTRVVAEFRDAAIASGQIVGTAGTMPQGLHGHAIALARWRFLISLPGNRALQTQDRKDAASRAQDILDAIAAGKRKVEGTTEGTTSIPSPSFSDKTRNYDRPSQDGL